MFIEGLCVCMCVRVCVYVCNLYLCRSVSLTYPFLSVSHIPLTYLLAHQTDNNTHSWGADALINSGLLSKTNVRKLFQCTALLVPAACMTALALGNHSPSEAQVGVGVLVCTCVIVSTIGLGTHAYTHVNTYT